MNQWQQPVHPQPTSRRRRTAIIVLVALTIVGGGIFWVSYQAYNFYNTNIAGMVDAVTKGELATTNPDKIAVQLQKIGFHQVPAGYTPHFGLHFNFMGQSLARIMLVPSALRPGMVKKRPTQPTDPDIPFEIDDITLPDPFKMAMIQVEYTRIEGDSGQALPKPDSEEPFNKYNPKVEYEKAFRIKVGGKERPGKRQKRTHQGRSYDYYEVQVAKELVVYAGGPWGKFDRKVLLKFLRSYRPPTTKAH